MGLYPTEAKKHVSNIMETWPSLRNSIRPSTTLGREESSIKNCDLGLTNRFHAKLYPTKRGSMILQLIIKEMKAGFSASSSSNAKDCRWVVDERLERRKCCLIQHHFEQADKAQNAESHCCDYLMHLMKFWSVTEPNNSYIKQY